jgi:hypothetical protein
VDKKSSERWRWLRFPRIAGETLVSYTKTTQKLAFEQQRFYNPHHHPEMPRTLQSSGSRAGHGEAFIRMQYDQAVVRLEYE